MDFKELKLEDLESTKNLRDFINENNSLKKYTNSEKKIFINTKSRKRFDSLDMENPFEIYQKNLIKKILKFEKHPMINFEDNFNSKTYHKSRKSSVIDNHELYLFKKSDQKKKINKIIKKNLKEQTVLQNSHNEDILNFSKNFQSLKNKKNDFILKIEKINKNSNFENEKTSLIILKKEISRKESVEENFEISKLTAKITKVSNFWSKTTFFIPNVFKLVKKIDNDNFLFESQDLSNKELLIQSNGLKSKITEKNFYKVLGKKNEGKENGS